MLGKCNSKLSLVSDRVEINRFFSFLSLLFHRDDMEMMLNKIVPEGLPYRHSCEGPDDMVRKILSGVEINKRKSINIRIIHMCILNLFFSPHT